MNEAIREAVRQWRTKVEGDGNECRAPGLTD